MPHLDLPPLTNAGGTVRLPGTKSISNRTLLLSALAGGNCKLSGMPRMRERPIGDLVDGLRQIGSTLIV